MVSMHDLASIARIARVARLKAPARPNDVRKTSRANSEYASPPREQLLRDVTRLFCTSAATSTTLVPWLVTSVALSKPQRSYTPHRRYETPCLGCSEILP